MQTEAAVEDQSRRVHNLAQLVGGQPVLGWQSRKCSELGREAVQSSSTKIWSLSGTAPAMRAFGLSSNELSSSHLQILSRR